MYMDNMSAKMDNLPAKTLEDIKVEIVQTENNLLNVAAKLKKQIIDLEIELTAKGTNPLRDRNYVRAIELEIELAKHLVKLKRNVIQIRENKDKVMIDVTAYNKFKED